MAEVVQEEPVVYTSLTPAGLEIAYSPAPRRHYKIRKTASQASTDWLEIPSVTSVLGVLDKSGALSWWAQGIACEGVLELFKRNVLRWDGEGFVADFGGDIGIWGANAKDIVDLLVKNRLSINHVTDRAANRGVSIHDAFEAWTVDQSFRCAVDLYPESEAGYAEGLNKFLDDIGPVQDVQAEIMVGSLEHGFAGRFDLLLTVPEVELVTKCYPKRKPKREVVPAGRVLVDLKTSKDCYPTHSLQLAAYEIAAIECGYGKPDYKAVLHVTNDGQYEFRRANATGDQFLSILQAYQTMTFKGWFA